MREIVDVEGIVAPAGTRPPAAERLGMLRQLLRIRAVEEAIAARYAEQEMRCPVHLSIGQEAAAVGVCGALRPDDYVLSTHRGHAHYLAKGGDLRAMLAELYGRATGCAGGNGGSMHLIDLAVGMMGCTPIVGSSLPVAVGIAFAARLLGQDTVTVAFLGEAATEEGVFAESINFAALRKLPVVFACENNGFSVYSPLSVRQPGERDRLAFARASGLQAGRADGNDVEAVLALTTRAVADARAGRGPSYLEFDTYRWREHCGPNYDDHLGYRDEAEFQAWRARCPVQSYTARLLADRVLAETDLEVIRRELDAEVAAAFAYAKAAPFPDAERLFGQVYAGEQAQ